MRRQDQDPHTLCPYYSDTLHSTGVVQGSCRVTGSSELFDSLHLILVVVLFYVSNFNNSGFPS